MKKQFSIFMGVFLLIILGVGVASATIVEDTTPPTLTVTGFTADGFEMVPYMGGYVLNTNNVAANNHLVQFLSGSVASEALKNQVFGLYLIPTEGQTALLVDYYSTKPPEYQTYLNAAAAGTQPFAYIEGDGTTSIKILDGAQYTLSGGTVKIDMVIPDNYPLGTYTVQGQIEDLTGNLGAVEFTLIVAGYCGDNNVDVGEECDNGERNGWECNLGYNDQCTVCSATCTSVTYYGDYCGDGKVNGPEQCDGGDGCSASCRLELDYAHTQWPCEVDGYHGNSFDSYGWIYLETVTEGAGQGAGIIGQAGYGSVDTNPADNPSAWTWSNDATYLGDQDGLTVGDLMYDEYVATLVLEFGSWDYGWRFSNDGGATWTYADLGGCSCDGQGTADGWDLPGTLDVAVTNVYNENQDVYYDSIQEAIDDADAYDTITISAGTYGPEDLAWNDVDGGFLRINEPLTLQGEGSENTIIDGEHLHSVIGGYDRTHATCLWIGNSDVNLEGLTIKGCDYGIRVSDAHSRTSIISELIFDDVTVTDNFGHGFVFEKYDGVSFSNINFIHCNANANGDRGIYFAPSTTSTEVTLTDTNADNNLKAGFNCQGTIDDLTISGGTFNGNTGGLNYEGNGPYFGAGLELDGVTNAVIDGIEANENGLSGPDVVEESGEEVSGGAGIIIKGNSDYITITDSEIIGNANGILIEYWERWSTPEPDNVVANYNKIQDNDYYDTLNWGEENEINAEYNWWGNNDGPDNFGEERKVYGRIDYSPFCVDEDCDYWASEGIAPVTTLGAITANDEVEYTEDTWTNQDVEINLSCTDVDGSGCYETYYLIEGQEMLIPASLSINGVEPRPYVYTQPFTLYTTGEYTITYWSVDNAENEEERQTFVVKIDKEGPEIGGMQNADTWFNTDFNFILSNVSWDISGKQSATYVIDDGEEQEFSETLLRDTELWYYALITQEGSHNLYYSLTDNAGNVNSGAVIVKKDSTAPTTTISAGEGYENGTWTKDEISVVLSCTDVDGSGCSQINYLINGEEPRVLDGIRRTVSPIGLEVHLPSFGAAGIYVITYWSVDNAGNIEDENTFTIKITASGMGGDWEFPEGSTTDSAEWVELHEDLDILLSDGSRVFLPAGTRITRTDRENLDLSELTYSDENASFLEGFEDWRVAEGALQFGIPSLGLEFSTPITIKIFVGTALDGQTLDIMRSVSGSDTWVNEGIVNPTCLVALGYCEFETTLASYFVTTSGSAPATTTTSGGGGGGCVTKWTCTAWETCSAAGDQTRTCSYPSNFCTPTVDKPAEVQSCSYVAPSENINTGGTTTPEEQGSATPTAGAGITGAVIGNLASPTGIGIIIVIAIVLVGGIVLITRRGKGKKVKKTSEKED